MTNVQTTAGLLPVAELGVTNVHDHLLIGPNPVTLADTDVLIDDVDDAVAEAQAFRLAGGSTIVDTMPTGSGRCIAGLAQVAEHAGVNVIATSGFHKPEYYGPAHWACRYDDHDLVQLLLDECREGIDVHDYAGPIISRTEIRPGLLKVAAGYDRLGTLERRWFRVVAEVHAETGLPIMVHADHGTIPLELVAELARHGVPVNRIAICHLDRSPDLGLHRELAETGAFLLYDGVGRERARPVAAVAEVISGIASAGYSAQLLLGGDVARHSMRQRSGGPGIAGLLDSYVPALQRGGVPEQVLADAMGSNAAAFLGVHTTSRP